jgi:hypothetical protein
MNTSYTGTNLYFYTLGSIGIISTLFYTSRWFNIFKKELKDASIQTEEIYLIEDISKNKIMKTTSIQCDLHLSGMEDEIEIVPASGIGNRWLFLKGIMGY